MLKIIIILIFCWWTNYIHAQQPFPKWDSSCKLLSTDTLSPEIEYMLSDTIFSVNNDKYYEFTLSFMGNGKTGYLKCDSNIIYYLSFSYNNYKGYSYFEIDGVKTKIFPASLDQTLFNFGQQIGGKVRIFDFGLFADATITLLSKVYDCPVNDTLFIYNIKENLHRSHSKFNEAIFIVSKERGILSIHFDKENNYYLKCKD